MPNSHYIPRSRGGLGTERNVVTMCMDCHRQYDNGSHGERAAMEKTVRKYLQGCYPGGKEEELIYRKGME